jgi:hypothetical protein
MDEFEIILEPLADDAKAGTGGHYRHKNPPGKTYRRVLLNRGDTLSARVRLALLGHGTITPNGEEASLLVFDFSLVSNRETQRFVRASFQFVFRDAAGDEDMDPDIYRIAPEGMFTIDARADPKNVKNNFNLGANLGLPNGGFNAGAGRETEKVKIKAHSVRLEGERRVLDKDWGDDNAVIWTMQEDADEKKGTPSFLRGALILRRKPGRQFAFSLEAETEGNFRVRDAIKKLCHFGTREHCVPVVEDSVITAPTHVLDAEDLLLSEYVKKIDWSNLHALKLHEDVVVHTMTAVLGAQPIAVEKPGLGTAGTAGAEGAAAVEGQAAQAAA